MKRNAAFKPVIVIDRRERCPLKFEHLTTITATLETGDYAIRGLETVFAVERKTIDDLAQSVTRGRERLERELLRLRGHSFARLLVIGDEHDIRNGRFRSDVEPRAVLHSLWAFEARYVPVAFSFLLGIFLEHFRHTVLSVG